MTISPLQRKHYFFGIFSGLLALYELPIALIASFPGIVGNEGLWGMIRKALNLAEFTPENIAQHQLTLSLWLFSIGCGYIFHSRYFDRQSNPKPKLYDLSAYVPFLVLMLAFGIISTATGAGASRLQDYTKNIYENDSAAGGAVTILNYGQALLVCCPIIIFITIQQKKGTSRTTWLIAITALCLPILREIFIAGRRQFFAPAILTTILIILYSQHLKSRKKVLAIIMGTALAVVTIQFSLRQITQSGAEISAEQVADSDLSILSFLSEFLGVGAISFNAVNSIGTEEATLGEHLLLAALKGIPVIHLDEFTTKTLNLSPWDRYLEITPFGAFPMLADAWLAGGWAGILLFGLAAGMATNIAHTTFRKATSEGHQLSMADVYKLSLFVTLLAQYRKGLTDTLTIAISFSILFFFTAYLPARLATIRSIPPTPH